MKSGALATLGSRVYLIRLCTISCGGREGEANVKSPPRLNKLGEDFSQMGWIPLARVPIKLHCFIYN